MFNNVALDIFIGLIFVFLLYSLLATILQEIIATRFAFRAKVLEKGILRMLEDGKTTGRFSYVDRVQGILHIFNIISLMEGKTVAPWFYAHPLIKYLAEDNWYSKPAYISPANFSKVMIDLLKGMDQPASQTLQRVHESIMNGTIHTIPMENPDLGNPAVKRLNKIGYVNQRQIVELNESTALFLQSLWADSGSDLTVFQAKLEQWFNDTMERTTGWFKKYIRIVLFFIGFILAISFNVDSLAIKRILTNNRSARESMVKMAIATQEHLDPDKLLNGDKSLLDSTFKLVGGDAEKANIVLGLGRPWKDSLSMWKDSLKSVDFQKRLATLQKSVHGLNTTSQSQKIKVDSLNLLLKTLLIRKDSIKNNAASIRIADSMISMLQISVQKKKEDFAKTSASLSEYNRIKFFKDRIKYIQARRKKKYFLYSPNQAGGAETFFGWIITALAVMLGAPFWFDLLTRFISLRGTGTKIDTSDSATPMPALVAPSANISTPSSNNNADQEAVG